MAGVKWSSAQRANRNRFKQAVAFARAALADPQQRAHYEEAAAKARKRAFEMAVSDFIQKLKEKSRAA